MLFTFRKQNLILTFLQVILAVFMSINIYGKLLLKNSLKAKWNMQITFIFANIFLKVYMLQNNMCKKGFIVKNIIIYLSICLKYDFKNNHPKPI